MTDKGWLNDYYRFRNLEKLTERLVSTLPHSIDRRIFAAPELTFEAKAKRLRAEKLQGWRKFWETLEETNFPSNSPNLALHKSYLRNCLLIQTPMPEMDLCYNEYLELNRQKSEVSDMLTLHDVKMLNYPLISRSRKFRKSLQASEKQNDGSVSSECSLSEQKKTVEFAVSLREYFRLRKANADRLDLLEAKIRKSSLAINTCFDRLILARFLRDTARKIELRSMENSIESTEKCDWGYRIKLEGSERVISITREFQFFEEVESILEKVTGSSQKKCHFCKKPFQDYELSFCGRKSNFQAKKSRKHKRQNIKTGKNTSEKSEFQILISGQSGSKMSKIKKTSSRQKRRRKYRLTPTGQRRPCCRAFCEPCLFKNFESESTSPVCVFCQGKCFCPECSSSRFIEKINQAHSEIQPGFAVSSKLKAPFSEALSSHTSPADFPPASCEKKVEKIARKHRQLYRLVDRMQVLEEILASVFVAKQSVKSLLKTIKKW